MKTVPETDRQRSTDALFKKRLSFLTNMCIFFGGMFIYFRLSKLHSQQHESKVFVITSVSFWQWLKIVICGQYSMFYTWRLVFQFQNNPTTSPFYTKEAEVDGTDSYNKHYSTYLTWQKQCFSFLALQFFSLGPGVWFKFWVILAYTGT